MDYLPAGALILKRNGEIIYVNQFSRSTCRRLDGYGGRVSSVEHSANLDTVDQSTHLAGLRRERNLSRLSLTSGAGLLVSRKYIRTRR